MRFCTFPGFVLTNRSPRLRAINKSDYAGGASMQRPSPDLTRDPMILTWFFAFTIIVLRLFPETATARQFQRVVDITRASFARIERRHLIFLALMTLILVVGAEMLAVAGPFDTALVLLWDVSTYVDIALTTAVAAAATRGGAGWRGMIARFLPRRAVRARRPRRNARMAPPSANNDDDRPACARAA